ncbi:MAG TPA: glycosyl hydrolase family 28-related protein [Ginsengibacter sp.]|nr:glycosyl hydrolase family 28-related protein [Ginsengibacter sp.]HRP17588.1 glycosyl hydrolase family 28-related protein [Ginsengibacter sp.]HRP43142.1 glycosyl hydrolase family 28-related protein [Ginsengibacter sp.]
MSCKKLVMVIFAGVLLSGNSLWAKDIYFNVKSFGARGNGKKDDAASIQKAINAAAEAGGVVYFPKGTYLLASFKVTNHYLENYILKLQSGIKLMGEGEKSVIKLGNNLFSGKETSANAHLFFGLNVSDISFSDFVIDLNGSRNPVPEGVLKNYAAIFVKNGSDVSVDRMIMKNTSGRTMMNIMGKGKGLSVENSCFFNGGTYPGNGKTNPYQDDFSFVYSEWDSTLVRNNLMKQEDVSKALTGYCGGLELHGSHSVAIQNQFVGCWPAIYISSTMGRNMEDVVVSNNKITQCVTGISFWLMDTMKDVTISQNVIHLVAPTGSRHKDIFVWGIVMPNGNVDNYDRNLANNAPVVNLRITNNTIQADSMGNVSGGISVHSLQNSVIDSNLFLGLNYSGINVAGSKWGIDSLVIDKNCFANFRQNTHPQMVGGYFVVTDTYSPKHKNPPGFKNILISDNDISDVLTPLPDGKGKIPSGFIALPPGQMKSIQFKNNLLNKALTEFKKVVTN